MARAKNLKEARRFLDPRPLDFSAQNKDGPVETNPDFYLEPPAEDPVPGGLKTPTPVENIRDELLADVRGSKKVFLCGHVGSGKSTELSRLIVDPEIQERFTVVPLRFEEQEWATLDSPQILFRLALAIYEFAVAQKLLAGLEARWEKRFKDLDERIIGSSGVQAREGSISAEYNLVIVKLKQELRLSEKARRQFRELGETEPTLLQDLLKALVNDVEMNLAKAQRPAHLLMVVDDLDKVRGTEQQQEIFHSNLNALLVPPVRIVYTIPTGVFFGEQSRPEARREVQHLFPIRVLKKHRGWNPEEACIEDRITFFHDLVAQRVEPGLIDAEAIRLAAIYSGGVLRDFFRLLRDGIRIALHNKLDKLNGLPMKYAVSEARRSESAGLYEPDYIVLEHVHRTNELKSSADRRLLDLSRVLECYNGSIWFEVNPLLWQLLEPHAAAAH